MIRAAALAMLLFASPALAQNMNPEGYVEGAEGGLRPMWARRAPPEYQRLPTGPVQYHRLPTLEASEAECLSRGVGNRSTACTFFYGAVDFMTASGRRIRRPSLCVVYYSDPAHLPHELDHCRMGRVGVSSHDHEGWR